MALNCLDFSGENETPEKLANGYSFVNNGPKYQRVRLETNETPKMCMYTAVFSVDFNELYVHIALKPFFSFFF